jgi:transposase
VVAAPSKVRRPAGDRVKTDAEDAVLLAPLLWLDDITAVAVPGVEQEAARDLVRAREDCRGDLMRAGHRLSKLLLRHGIVYHGGAAWTGKHDTWLPAAARIRGDQGNQRLHHRWVNFIDRRERHTVATVAIARELAGWCWSLAILDAG